MKNHLKLGKLSLICLCYCLCYGQLVFEWTVMLPTKFSFCGTKPTNAFHIIFQSLQLDDLYGTRGSFKVHFTFSTPQASEWQGRLTFPIFLGRSIFLSLTLNDVMASNMDLWATLTRVKSIQKGNSNKQYVTD